MAAEPSPEPSGAMSGRRASVTALAGVLGAVALMLLLVTWAATIGPDEVVRGEGNPPSYETLADLGDHHGRADRPATPGRTAVAIATSCSPSSRSSPRCWARW